MTLTFPNGVVPDKYKEYTSYWIAEKVAEVCGGKIIQLDFDSINGEVYLWFHVQTDDMLRFKNLTIAVHGCENAERVFPRMRQLVVLQFSNMDVGDFPHLYEETNFVTAVSRKQAIEYAKKEAEEIWRRSESKIVSLVNGLARLCELGCLFRDRFNHIMTHELHELLERGFPIYARLGKDMLNVTPLRDVFAHDNTYVHRDVVIAKYRGNCVITIKGLSTKLECDSTVTFKIPVKNPQDAAVTFSVIVAPNEGDKLRGIPRYESELKHNAVSAQISQIFVYLRAFIEEAVTYYVKTLLEYTDTWRLVEESENEWLAGHLVLSKEEITQHIAYSLLACTRHRIMERTERLGKGSVSLALPNHDINVSTSDEVETHTVNLTEIWRGVWRDPELMSEVPLEFPPITIKIEYLANTPFATVRRVVFCWQYPSDELVIFDGTQPLRNSKEVIDFAAQLMEKLVSHPSYNTSLYNTIAKLMEHLAQ